MSLRLNAHQMSERVSTPRGFAGLLVFLAVSAGYLYTFPQPNVFYAGIVLLHALAGLIAIVWLALLLTRLLRNGTIVSSLGWVLVAGGATLGLVLIRIGTARSEWNWFYLHIILSLGGIGLLLADWTGRRGWLSAGASGAAGRVVIFLAVLAGLGLGARYVRESGWLSRARIENPSMPPAAMNDEGDGSQGAFFPSSAQVYGGAENP